MKNFLSDFLQDVNNLSTAIDTPFFAHYFQRNVPTIEFYEAN